MVVHASDGSRVGCGELAWTNGGIGGGGDGGGVEGAQIAVVLLSVLGMYHPIVSMATHVFFCSHNDEHPLTFRSTRGGCGWRLVVCVPQEKG